MRHKEGCLDVAAVGVLQVAIEEPLDLLVVVVVDRVIERDDDHLGHLVRGEVAGDLLASRGAEAFRQPGSQE